MQNDRIISLNGRRPVSGGLYECAVAGGGRMEWMDEQRPDRTVTLIDVLADRRVDPSEAVAVHMGALFGDLVGTYDWALMMERHALTLLAGDQPDDSVLVSAEDLAASLSWAAGSLQESLDDLSGVIAGLCASGPGGDWPFEPTEAWRRRNGTPTPLDLARLELPPELLVGVAAQMARTVTVIAQLRRSCRLMERAAEQPSEPG